MNHLISLLGDNCVRRSYEPPDTVTGQWLSSSLEGGYILVTGSPTQRPNMEISEIICGAVILDRQLFSLLFWLTGLFLVCSRLNLGVRRVIPCVTLWSGLRNLTIEVVEYWSIGVLKYSSTGVPEYWRLYSDAERNSWEVSESCPPPELLQPPLTR